MNRLGTTWRIYVVPGAVFQSLMIGGGYGTGREVVEYFSRFGLLGGVLGLSLVMICFAILLSVSFELARVCRAYDYRQFFRQLLGKGWIAFEIVYLAMFALVLAVVAAASGQMVEEHTSLSATTGVSLLLATVVVLSFYGRVWVMRVLAYKAVILSVAFGIFLTAILLRWGDRVSIEWGRHEIVDGWAMAALRYTMYSSVTIPVLLFATRSIEEPRQALISGIAASVFGILPAVLLHLSFGAAYPSILTQSIPAYTMILALGVPVLTLTYLVILFGSLLDVGLGFIQSINERIDGWFVERNRPKPSRLAHAGVALACVLASGALSTVGIVPLIAQGYGAMSYMFLVLFVAPLLTIGVHRIVNAHRQQR